MLLNHDGHQRPWMKPRVRSTEKKIGITYEGFPKFRRFFFGASNVRFHPGALKYLHIIEEKNDLNIDEKYSILSIYASPIPKGTYGNLPFPLQKTVVPAGWPTYLPLVPQESNSRKKWPPLKWLRNVFESNISQHLTKGPSTNVEIVGT